MTAYDRIVLTVIAVALAVLALDDGVAPSAAGFGSCGESRAHPCYIATVNG
jgi:hypothetical protein